MRVFVSSAMADSLRGREGRKFHDEAGLPVYLHMVEFAAKGAQDGAGDIQSQATRTGAGLEGPEELFGCIHRGAIIREAHHKGVTERVGGDPDLRVRDSGDSTAGVPGQ